MASKLIGTFTRHDKGFTGSLRTLHLHLGVNIVPSTLSGDKSPDWLVLAGKERYALGAGWTQNKDTETAYLTLRLDDPSFPATLTCRLVRPKNSDHWLLFWDRKAD
jgi:uncharacterized protein (DUF736 family)